MRYEDASQAGSNEHSETIARPDVETLPPGSFGPATGNAITGQGTSTGAAGADSVAAGPASVIAVQGAGGSAASGSGGFDATGQYGVLSMDAQGNFNYVRNPNSPDGVKDVFNYTLADSAGGNASTTLTINIAQAAAAEAGQQGAIVLPAGVELSDIHVNGRDLVINMPDGTQMVIPNGAVFVPEITIGDVEVPPTNVAALLVDSEPQPAAGTPPSSGGNWNDPVAPLDPGVPLGDLIPPTELGHTPPVFQEPAQGIDTEPTIIIQTPDFPAGAVDASESVDEKGLPSRDGDLLNEPAGSGEIADGNGANNSDGSETNTGTIVFTAEDGVDSITINGEEVTAVGQQIEGEFGTLTITGIDLENGQITYSYTLGDNTSGDATQDVFAIVVTDDDGDTANGSLTVNILDDHPTALDDTDSTDLVTHIATGNVMTGAGTTSGAAGADTVGADNATLTSVSSNGTGQADSSFDASGNLVVEGEFGTLTIKADGSYTYALHSDAPGGSVDVFTYTLTDGDGDADTATLTITNPDHQPTVGANPVVQLDDDALAGGNAGGVGDDPDSVNATGTLSGSGGDGALTFALTANGAPEGFTYALQANGQLWVMQGSTHVLTITVNASTGAYEVAQVAPIMHAEGDDENNVQFDISYTVTDSDGDAATGHLTVNVDDDTPVAQNDTDSVGTGQITATGNVITGASTTSGASGADHYGADGAGSLIGVSSNGTGQSDTTFDASGNLVVHGDFGTLTIKADGSYVYTLDQNAPSGAHSDVFTYTIVDADGDTDTATLTITSVGPDEHPTVDVPTEGEPGTAVSETGLPTRNGGEPEGTGEGANPAPNTDNSEITSGTITYTDGDGASTVTIQGTGGPVVVAAGVDIVGTYGTLHIDTFDPATHTITYTYTLNDNVDHDSQPGSDSFKVIVSDADGNPADDASGTLTIKIADDHPIAVADTDSVTEGHQTSGDVLTGAGGDGNPTGADIPGADNLPANPVVGVAAGDTDANLTNGAGVGGTGVHGTYGTLVLNADGTYTYTADPNTNPPAGATDVFTYTIIDNDGTASHTTITISVIDDQTPSVHVPTAGEAGTSVDEQGLPAHNGRPEGSGEAANPAPNTDQSEITSGTITYTEGDAPATVTINGVTVVAGADIVGTYGTLHIDSIDTTTHTITYTYTLTNNVDNDSQTASDSFDVVVSDSDGNPADDAHATLTIDIVDDGPIARDDTDSVIEGDHTGGNVLTGVGGDGNAAGADTPGADGYAPNAVVGVAVGDTNANLTTGSGVGGAGVHGTYGTLVLNADGSYTYTADPNTNPPANATDTFTYTIIDNDGTASNATLTIAVVDDFQPQIGTAENLAVDEDGLPTANLDSGAAGEVDHGANDTDSGTVTVDFGTDRPGATEAEWLDAFSFINPNTLDGDLTQNGVPIDFSIDGSGNLVGKIGSTTIITISVTGAVAGSGGNVTYTYSVDLDGPVDQLSGDNTEGSVVLSGVQFQVTDADGDPASSSFNVTIYDDIPKTFTPDDAQVGNDTGSVTGVSLDLGDGNINNNVGADKPGVVRFPSSLEGSDSGMTSALAPILYHVSADGSTLIGYVDSGDNGGFQGGEDTTVFTITLDQSTSSYSVQMSGHVDAFTHVDFDGGSYDHPGGNPDYYAFFQTGDNDSPDLLITPVTNGVTAGTINLNSNTFGVSAGNSVGAGEAVRLDYVTDIVTSGGSIGDWTFDGHYTTNGATIDFAKTGGSTVKLTAYDDADGNNTVGDGTPDAITSIAISYNGGTASNITTNGTYNVGGHDFVVTFNADGTVSVAGVVGDTLGTVPTTIAVFTADGYNSLEAAYQAGETFKVGNFGAAVQSTDPVDFSVPVEIVDADGDVVAGDDINVTITAPSQNNNVVQHTSSLTTDSDNSTHNASTHHLVSGNDNHRSSAQDRALGAGHNAAVMAALAAAGLEADHMKLGLHDLPQHALHVPEMAPLQAPAIAAAALHTAGSAAPAHIVQPVASSHAVQAARGGHAQDIAEQAHGVSHGDAKPVAAVTDLLHASDGVTHGPAIHAAPVMAPTVAMPSAQQLTAAASKPAEGAQHNEVVGKVLADSLNGGEGHGPNIDALLSGATAHGVSHDVLEALASHAAGASPLGHTAVASAFTGGHSMLVAMMHHDAAPPAHG